MLIIVSRLFRVFGERRSLDTGAHAWSGHRYIDKNLGTV
jgi:hypothetical protein